MMKTITMIMMIILSSLSKDVIVQRRKNLFTQIIFAFNKLHFSPAILSQILISQVLGSAFLFFCINDSSPLLSVSLSLSCSLFAFLSLFLFPLLICENNSLLCSFTKNDNVVYYTAIYILYHVLMLT